MEDETAELTGVGSGELCSCGVEYEGVGEKCEGVGVEKKAVGCRAVQARRDTPKAKPAKEWEIFITKECVPGSEEAAARDCHAVHRTLFGTVLARECHACASGESVMAGKCV